MKRFLQGNADLQIILWVKKGNPRIEILSAVDFLRLLSLRVGSLFGDVRLRRLKKAPLKSCFTYRRCVSGIPAAWTKLLRKGLKIMSFLWDLKPYWVAVFSPSNELITLAYLKI